MEDNSEEFVRMRCRERQPTIEGLWETAWGRMHQNPDIENAESYLCWQEDYKILHSVCIIAVGWVQFAVTKLYLRQRRVQSL